MDAGPPHLVPVPAPAQQLAMAIHPRLLACLPPRLHPVSRKLLEAWVSGRLSTPTFQRFFHMPNSDYLPVGECLVQVMADLRSHSKDQV